jgi:putative tricarboxylic transport membrane protein
MHEAAAIWNVLLGPVLAAIGGVLWGIIGGALPGISASIAIALLAPFTLTMPPTIAIVALASTYIGAEYGGSIPAILIRTPGTNSAAATVIDGYELQKAGRGGEALGVSLASAVTGALFGLAIVVLLTKPLSHLALAFTPPAYFALGIFGISVISSLSESSLLKGLISGILGLMITTIGTDPLSGVSRFTFGQVDLIDGIKVVIVMMGVFAVSELFIQVDLPAWQRTGRDTRLKLPNWQTLKGLWRAQLIGSVIGTLEGVTPGVGGSVAAFLSYNEARRWSREPEKFGHGSLEGIAAPETANGTVAYTALIPTLSFGIPGSNSTAVLLGALWLHGLQPGPMLFKTSAGFVETLYAGLLLAVAALFLLGLVVLSPCVWLVNRPKPFLLASILALIVSGAFSIDSSVFNIGIVLTAGVLGYALRYAGFPLLPLVLGLVLGSLIESNLRRSLLLSGGDLMIFLTDPVSCALLLCAAFVSLVPFVRRHRTQKEIK